jgi:hypothetical protein
MTNEFCYFVLPSIRNQHGHFVPCIAKLGERGYFPTNYDYGDDLEIARQAVNEINADLGLTPKDAAYIVASSMRTHD